MYEFFKKIALIILLISVTLIALSQETTEVQPVSNYKISNMNVGNECSHDVTVNQKALCEYRNLNFNLSETSSLVFKITCSEYDENYSDFGCNTKIINLNKRLTLR